MRSMLIVGLLVCVMAGGGCCTMCNPCGQGCFDYAPNCGASCGYCGTCSSCSPCDVGCGAPCSGGPVRWALGVLGFRCFGCCNGCGEEYWGDWCSSPPDCCDPCDQCGNYVGGYSSGGGGCSSCAGGGGHVNEAYSGAPRSARPVASKATATRHVASAPRRMPVQANAAPKASDEPQILSETDEAIQPAADAPQYQANAPHRAPAR